MAHHRPRAVCLVAALFKAAHSLGQRPWEADGPGRTGKQGLSVKTHVDATPYSSRAQSARRSPGPHTRPCPCVSRTLWDPQSLAEWPRLSLLSADLRRLQTAPTVSSYDKIGQRLTGKTDNELMKKP